MSLVDKQTELNLPDKGHVTTRRGRVSANNMAHDGETRAAWKMTSDSLLIDSILTQDESKDVVSMMIMANEMEDYTRLPSFCTSTQMGGTGQLRRPTSPQLSPLTQRPTTERYLRPGEDSLNKEVRRSFDDRILSRSPLLCNEESVCENFDIGSPDRDISCSTGGSPGNLPNSIEARVAKLLDDAGGATIRDGAGHVPMAGNQAGNQATANVNKDGNSDGEQSGESGGGRGIGEAEEVESLSGDREEPRAGVKPDEVNNTKVGISEGSQGSDLAKVVSKLSVMEAILIRLDDKSTKMNETVRDLEDSLEFSQNEIVNLKKENAELRQHLGAVETEDKRTQFQVNSLEDKLDKLETATKRKNLVIEGIPESEGGKEHTEKAIGNLFDQLGVQKGINFDACYRIGPYNKNRTRPVMVVFERQADRDGIYSRRLDLKHTKNYQKVWLNEDLGALSKRKRGLIRLISKEAQQQGIDCKTGKYSIHLDKKKIDSENMEELPPPLQLTTLKQVQLDNKTLAYQSEFAPFSNFFHCTILAGKHKFFCLEQAFQFLHAKSLNKPLIATKIYLSRDVRYIKQLGRELGTSTEWENKQFDLMYECLKKKFDQNPHLKALLLDSGDLELVEATPDRLWGCGATLSSNAIRRRSWPGQNKHGQILMTIRQEYRNEMNEG